MKIDYENATTEELRDYLIEQIDKYHAMFKDLKKKHKEVDKLLKEARLLVNKIKEGE